MSRRERLLAAGAVVATLAMAGCGSTVQDQGSTLAAGGTGLTVSSDGTVPTPGSGLTVPGGGATPGSQSFGQGPGAATGPGSAIPGGTSTTGTAPQATLPPGSGHGPQTATAVPGITPNSIYIGVSYTVNGDAANAALGASSVTQGDEKADATAVIKQINATGGVAGRKLVPVFYPFDATSTDTYSDMDQQECADFTQDHHVFVSTDAGLTDTFQQCMRNANVPIVFSGDINTTSDATFQKFPTFFDLGAPSTDSVFAAEVPSLVRQHYFTGWNTTLGQPSSSTPVKIGVLGIDVPDWTGPEHSILLPELRRAGYTVAPQDLINIYNPNSAGEDTQTINGIQNAELKFAQDGVTHVILLDSNGGLTLFFANAARSQHYYPRLGINSGTGAEALAGGSPPDVDPAQFAGAVGLGWSPSLDLSASAGNKYAGPATKKCLKIQKKWTGQTYDSTNAASIALGYCDTIFMVAAAIDKAAAAGALDAQTFETAVASFGEKFPAAGAPAIEMTPTRHYGAVDAWDMRWNSSCTCAQYVGNVRRLP